MTTDKLVIDIETKNSFADVGGRNRLEALDVSVTCIYSYNEDRYFCLDEHQMDELAEWLRNAGLVIGFALKRFDLPVLNKYMPFDLMRVKYLDMLEEIEHTLGRRIGLGVLAETNLGIGKTGHGLEAIDLYRDGRMDELKSYCINDVKITKDLYDLAVKQGHLMIPNRYSGQNDKAVFDWKQEILPQVTLF